MSTEPGSTARARPVRRPLPAALAVALLLTAACDGDPGQAPGVTDWSAAAEAVRGSVHSLWASVPALGGSVRAFAPVGTAFVVARDGVLLTNAHVLGDTAGDYPRLSVLVQTDTGSTLHEAHVLARDTVRDLGLIEIDDTTLTPVRWADQRAPMGTPVATLGFGLPEGGIVDTAQARVKTRYTVFRRFTAGYSSGYRTLVAGDPATNILEVDLFLFPGVSGGPTFGLDGRVIGVNMGRREYAAGATSYGHVIPRLVVAQFLQIAGAPLGIDSTRVFHPARDTATSP
jgi:S1-C subfamily serine protease